MKLVEIGLNASRMVGSHPVLFEGNYGFNFDSDHTHGNSIAMTVFRNHLRGVRMPYVNPHTGHIGDDSVQQRPWPASLRRRHRLFLLHELCRQRAGRGGPDGRLYV